MFQCHHIIDPLADAQSHNIKHDQNREKNNAGRQRKRLVVGQRSMSRPENENGNAHEIEHHRRHVHHVVGPVAPAGKETVPIAEDFFGPEVNAAFAGYRWASSITAIPCGQKKRTNEIIQSQIVTPPFAAMDGKTFRLKTADDKKQNEVTLAQHALQMRLRATSNRHCAVVGRDLAAQSVHSLI